MRLGNGRWETAKFNTRLQVTELGLGSSATDAGVWKTQYDYGQLDAEGDVVASKNTGNIARQTLTVPGTSFVQSYRYDSLYRLTEAAETTGSTTNWSQTWSYDRYGNRIGFAQDIAGNTNAPNPTVDPNTNRFNAGQNIGYDANGNVVSDIDPLTSLPRQFVFNGDNKQSEVKRDGVTIGRYFYDGEGKRVKKETDTETTVFVYSAGKLIAEYSTQLSQSPSIAYTTTDHLGTPRVITDQFGQVKARRDFMPFGEELYTGVGGRTGDTGLKYSSNQDDIRQKFTGYQNDKETGLDFAEARMYENRLGRFTAVDPLLASGKSSNPQTFNRYVYVINSPLIFFDPTGEFPISIVVRVFAPFEWFGPGRIARGDGSDRRFSARPDESRYRIAARTQYETNDRRSTTYSFGSRSEVRYCALGYCTSVTGWSQGYVRDERNKRSSKSTMIEQTGQIKYHLYGNDSALFPGLSGRKSPTPDIDIHSSFGVAVWNYRNPVTNKNEKDRFVLNIMGRVEGDRFPAAEVMVNDRKGVGVLLGVFAIPMTNANKDQTGPLTDLPGDNRGDMIWFQNVQIVTNREGDFLGVLQDGKMIRIDDWNRQFQNRPTTTSP
ncbi:MAG: hypothetical protein KF762_18445 [Acidobacteria bacterium]|nr:hypothetical protein [Acidobacteriota bacterium]